MRKEWAFKLVVFVGSALGVCAAVYRGPGDPVELPNRIPEAAPYVTREAQFFPPPFEEFWKGANHPGQCESCHPRIFEEWRGSMMANAWRDPVWRGAFLLSARQTATRGDCDQPSPPDGTARARLNPFAREGECASTFDLGDGRHTLSRPGSLLDGFCSRCHMPTNYVDNVALHDVEADAPSGLEHGRLDLRFDPTSDDGTGIAFATVDAQFRNTDSGKSGVSCAVCHSMVETRDTPYHNLARAEAPPTPEYTPALGKQARSSLLPGAPDIFAVPDPTRPNLGYAVGAGSFRLSPHAIGFPERLGPLSSREGREPDRYLEGVFRQPMPYEAMDGSKHHGYHHVLLTRAEMCSACHDVTNPLTLKNRLGRWVGGFPIERTYAEWLGSRYADRPGNAAFDPRFKRDCQTCHMQQDHGQPGTAQTLYRGGAPEGPQRGPAALDGPDRRHFTHHFVGGNAYMPHVIGASVDTAGTVQPYPELSVFSFTSADESSPYHNAYWTRTGGRGAPVQQARLAWDRLRHVLDLEVSAPRSVGPGGRAPLRIRVTNSGSGHKFPTGFPEGRNAWLAVRAFDLASGRELDIHDSTWNRASRGVGGLTRTEMPDPSFPQCDWKLPAGSPDPYAVQFRAVASLGDGCPTLDLVYAHPLNLVVNGKGQPIDEGGRVIDRRNPRGQPRFEDRDGDGDLYDDSFLADTRLDPLPRPGATVSLDRYSVVIPADVAGPVAVTVAVYYQSVEAVAAVKLLGNLADTDLDFQLEPCVLGGLCDGRTPVTEPAVVEGSPPVPMEVRSLLVRVGGPVSRPAPAVSLYPADGATEVYRDVVVKASFSEPVGLDAARFVLRDSQGAPVPASVDQVGDGTWALFPHEVFLKGGETYTAQLAAEVCGFDGNCTREARAWRFTTAKERGEGRGDTRIPLGFPTATATPEPTPPAVKAIQASAQQGVVVTFSEPVMNVTRATLTVAEGSCPGRALPGTVSSNPAGDVWTFRPEAPLRPGASHCVRVAAPIYDLEGQGLAQPAQAVVKASARDVSALGSPPASQPPSHD